MNHLIANRPILGVALSGGGAVSAILTWLNILTPIIGFAGACFGLVAGFYTFRIQMYKWRELRKQTAKPSLVENLINGGKE